MKKSRDRWLSLGCVKRFLVRTTKVLDTDEKGDGPQGIHKGGKKSGKKGGGGKGGEKACGGGKK